MSLINKRKLWEKKMKTSKRWEKWRSGNEGRKIWKKKIKLKVRGKEDIWKKCIQGKMIEFIYKNYARMIKIILKSLIITTIMNSSIICIDPLTYFSHKSILHTPHYTYRNILCGNIRKYLPPRFQSVSQLGHPIYTCVIPTPPTKILN